MFLDRQKTKHHDEVCIVGSFEEGADRARKFVGDHNKEDGCSSVPTERGARIKGLAAMTVSRSTSFGTRFASVQPISHGIMMEMVNG